MVCEVETSEPTRFLLKSITTNHLCRSGGMVYTLVLGTSASQLVGSSPTFGTKNCSSSHEGRENIKPFKPIGEVVDKYLYINTARVIRI